MSRIPDDKKPLQGIGELSGEDQLLIRRIGQGVETIDLAYADMQEPPGLQYIQRMVIERKGMIRRKLRMELLFFTLIASALLTGGLLLAYSSMEVFVVAQAVIIIVVVPMLFIWQHRGKRQENYDASI